VRETIGGDVACVRSLGGQLLVCHGDRLVRLDPTSGTPYGTDTLVDAGEAVVDAFVLQRDVAAVTESGDVILVDTADPRHRLLIEAADIGGRAIYVGRAGSDVYVAVDGAGLAVARTDEWTSVAVVRTGLLRSSGIGQFGIADGVMYFVPSSGFGVQSVSLDDLEEELIAWRSPTIASIVAIEARLDKLYVLSRREGLYIYSLNGTAVPTQLAALNVRSGTHHALATADGAIFVASSNVADGNAGVIQLALDGDAIREVGSIVVLSGGVVISHLATVGSSVFIPNEWRLVEVLSSDAGGPEVQREIPFLSVAYQLEWSVERSMLVAATRLPYIGLVVLRDGVFTAAMQNAERGYVYGVKWLDDFLVTTERQPYVPGGPVFTEDSLVFYRVSEDGSYVMAKAWAELGGRAASIAAMGEYAIVVVYRDHPHPVEGWRRRVYVAHADRGGRVELSVTPYLWSQAEGLPGGLLAKCDDLCDGGPGLELATVDDAGGITIVGELVTEARTIGFVGADGPTVVLGRGGEFEAWNVGSLDSPQDLGRGAVCGNITDMAAAINAIAITSSGVGQDCGGVQIFGRSDREGISVGPAHEDDAEAIVTVGRDFLAAVRSGITVMEYAPEQPTATSTTALPTATPGGTQRATPTRDAQTWIVHLPLLSSNHE